MKMYKLLVMAVGCVLMCGASLRNWDALDVRERNEIIIREYSRDCGKKNIPFPLGKIGWHNMDDLYAKYPEVKAAREKFLFYYNAMEFYLTRNDEYRKLNSWWTSLSIEDKKLYREKYNKENRLLGVKLYKTDSEYRELRVAKARAIIESNKITLDKLIQEYRQNNRIFPIDWIEKKKIEEYRKRFENSH